MARTARVSTLLVPTHGPIIKPWPKPPAMAMDRTPRFLFEEVRRAEVAYARQLNMIARQTGELIQGAYDPSDPNWHSALDDILQRFADAITPWATAAASRMVREVDARNAKAWRATGKEMGQLIGREWNSTPTGQLALQRVAEQVNLIRSLPLEAAQRVQKLATEAMIGGIRPENMIDEIMKSGAVTRSRAALIARTETGRTATEFTRSRAEQVGSTLFIWRTVKDSDVRPSHRRLEGKSFRWDDPPECDPGYHALPGAIFNCRCWPEPVLNEY